MDGPEQLRGRSAAGYGDNSPPVGSKWLGYIISLIPHSGLPFQLDVGLVGWDRCGHDRLRSNCQVDLLRWWTALFCLLLSIENGSDVFGNGYAEGESYPSVLVSMSSAAPLTAQGQAVFSKTTTLSRSLSVKWTLLIDGVGGSDLERVWAGSWPIAGEETDDLREDLRGRPRSIHSNVLESLYDFLVSFCSWRVHNYDFVLPMEWQYKHVHPCQTLFGRLLEECCFEENKTSKAFSKKIKL